MDFLTCVGISSILLKAALIHFLGSETSLKCNTLHIKVNLTVSKQCTYISIRHGATLVFIWNRISGNRRMILIWFEVSLFKAVFIQQNKQTEWCAATTISRAQKVVIANKMANGRLFTHPPDKEKRFFHLELCFRPLEKYSLSFSLWSAPLLKASSGSWALLWSPHFVFLLSVSLAVYIGFISLCKACMYNNFICLEKKEEKTTC